MNTIPEDKKRELNEEIIQEIETILSFEETNVELAHRQQYIKILWEAFKKLSKHLPTPEQSAVQMKGDVCEGDCPICNGSLHYEIRCDKCGGHISASTVISQSPPTPVQDGKEDEGK